MDILRDSPIFGKRNSHQILLSLQIFTFFQCSSPIERSQLPRCNSLLWSWVRKNQSRRFGIWQIHLGRSRVLSHGDRSWRCSMSCVSVYSSRPSSTSSAVQFRNEIDQGNVKTREKYRGSALLNTRREQREREGLIVSRLIQRSAGS